MTKHDCTRKVQLLRHNSTDVEVCKKLGICKNTLYTRLRQNNWKVSEISHISKL